MDQTRRELFCLVGEVLSRLRCLDSFQTNPHPLATHANGNDASAGDTDAGGHKAGGTGAGRKVEERQQADGCQSVFSIGCFPGKGLESLHLTSLQHLQKTRLALCGENSTAD